jgi:pyruvate kinase
MLEVKIGDMLVLDSELKEHDGGKTLPVQYNLAEKMKVGELLYMFDGRVRSTVREIVSPTAIRVEVENDGYLRSRKGLNLPDTDFGGDIMTPKDIADMEWGVDKDFDYLALSFIQTAEDVHSLRQRLIALGSTVDIISKIETKSAISDENLEEIVKVSDGIMVARGDLAVEAGAEIVPVVQRRIVALCRKHGKMSIVATQMMGSMVDNPEPSRAEVSDVANAVIQGADVVMLSDETANGKYPIETVKAMRKTIMYTQEHSNVEAVNKDESRKKTDAAISYSAVRLAQDINADAIIAETSSGATAVNIAAFRPNLPIISLTDKPRTAQKLALSYATRSYVGGSGLEAAGKLAEQLKQEGYFGEGPTTLVFVSGYAPGKPGTTNNIQVRVI